MRQRIAAAVLFIGTLYAAAQPAIPPATAPAGPREAVRGFFRALLAGNDKAAFEFLSFAKPENRKLAESLFLETAASQRLLLAAQAQFGKEAAAALDLAEEQAVQIEKNLDQAKLTLKSDTAEIIVDPKMPPFILIQKAGTWKIDFEKTQENMGPPPSAQDAAASLKIAAAYDQITAAIVSKKLKSISEVRDQVQLAQRQTAPAPTPEKP